MLFLNFQDLENKLKGYNNFQPDLIANGRSLSQNQGLHSTLKHKSLYSNPNMVLSLIKRHNTSKEDKLNMIIKTKQKNQGKNIVQNQLDKTFQQCALSDRSNIYDAASWKTASQILTNTDISKTFNQYIQKRTVDFNNFESNMKNPDSSRQVRCHSQQQNRQYYNQGNQIREYKQDQQALQEEDDEEEEEQLLIKERESEEQIDQQKQYQIPNKNIKLNNEQLQQSQLNNQNSTNCYQLLQPENSTNSVGKRICLFSTPNRRSKIEEMTVQQNNGDTLNNENETSFEKLMNNTMNNESPIYKNLPRKFANNINRNNEYQQQQLLEVSSNVEKQGQKEKKIAAQTIKNNQQEWLGYNDYLQQFSNQQESRMKNEQNDDIDKDQIALFFKGNNNNADLIYKKQHQDQKSHPLFIKLQHKESGQDSSNQTHRSGLTSDSPFKICRKAGTYSHRQNVSCFQQNSAQEGFEEELASKFYKFKAEIDHKMQGQRHLMHEKGIINTWKFQNENSVEFENQEGKNTYQEYKTSLKNQLNQKFIQHQRSWESSPAKRRYQYSKGRPQSKRGKYESSNLENYSQGKEHFYLQENIIQNFKYHNKRANQKVTSDPFQNQQKNVLNFSKHKTRAQSAFKCTSRSRMDFNNDSNSRKELINNSNLLSGDEGLKIQLMPFYLGVKKKKEKEPIKKDLKDRYIF